jgi:large subunit ribosomal protein L1
MAKEKREKSPEPEAGAAAVAEKAPKGERPPRDGQPQAAEAPRATKAKKAKPEAAVEEAGRSKKRGRPMRGVAKKFKAALAKRPDKPVPVAEAVKLLQEMGKGRKFDQTVNIVMHLGIDPKQADQMIRGAVSLPKGIGKARRVIAFAEGEDAEKARAAGAVEVGTDDLIAKISGGWTDFDVAIAHSRLMGKVGKLGKVLGPAGKMPSPKNGTVTNDVATAVKEFAAGKTEFKNDPGGNVHGIVGKLSFKAEDLKENIEAFVEHIRRMRPQTAKGHYIKRICVSATMTPSVELPIPQ